MAKTPFSIPAVPHARFNVYVAALRGRRLALDEDYVAEVGERLGQLEFILERVPEAARAIDAIGDEMSHELSVLVSSQGAQGPVLVASSTTPGADPIFERHFLRKHRLIVEVKTLTEAFYYGAARILRITKDLLPGLCAFRANGVRDVRNHLIEHPEGAHSRITSVSFALDDTRGAVLKPQRDVGREHVFPDRGLYPNATEFMTNLAALLEAATIRIEQGS